MGTPIDPTKTPVGPYMSSNNIVWQGPDIECISLCKGDNITDVVYKLATKLCEGTEGIIDITTIDFKTLVESTEPENMVQVIQLLIDSIIDLQSGEEPGASYEEPILTLPECLQYVDEGDTITALPQSEFSLLLATNICDILAEIITINTTIEDLSDRVATLETTVAALPEAVILPTINTSDCLGLGATATIKESVEAIDEALCTLRGTIGTDAELIDAIAAQCAGISSEDQLSDPESLMSALTGWVISPVTVADTINNLWLVICDMRSKVVDIVTDMESTDCITNPVASLDSTVTVTAVTLDWTAPVGSSESPVGYKVVIKNPSDVVIYTITVSPSTYSYVHSVGLTTGITYTAEVTPIYNCGVSTAVTEEFALECNDCSYILKIVDNITGGGIGGYVTIDGIVYNKNTTDISTTGIELSTGCTGAKNISVVINAKDSFTIDGELTWQGNPVLVLENPGTSAGTYNLTCVEGGTLLLTINETAA